MIDETDLKLMQWADELRTELSTWPREELIALIIRLKLNEGVGKMVDKLVGARTKELHQDAKRRESLLRKNRK